jgi:phospholipase/carboxylesterase
MNNLPLTHQFFPSKTASNKLMIILHGRGDSSNGFTWLPSYFKMDDMNYLLLDAPYDYYGGRSWYDLPPNQLEGIEYSKKILTEILDQLFEERFDPSQTILFGFSQGSLLTFEFGTRYPKPLAAYIGISGYIYNVEKLLEEMNPVVKKAKWLCTHGTDDDILPYNVSKSQVEVLQKGGFDVEFLTYEKDHTIIKEELDSMITWILEVYKAS